MRPIIIVIYYQQQQHFFTETIFVTKYSFEFKPFHGIRRKLKQTFYAGVFLIGFL